MRSATLAELDKLKNTAAALDVYKRDLMQHGIPEVFIDFLKSQLLPPNPKQSLLTSHHSMWKKQSENNMEITLKFEVVATELINAYARPGHLNQEGLNKFKKLLESSISDNKFTKYMTDLNTLEKSKENLMNEFLEHIQLPSNPAQSKDIEIVRTKIEEVTYKIAEHKSKIFVKLKADFGKRLGHIYKIAKETRKVELSLLAQGQTDYEQIESLREKRDEINNKLCKLVQEKKQIEEQRVATKQPDWNEDRYREIKHEIKKHEFGLNANEQFINAVLKVESEEKIKLKTK